MSVGEKVEFAKCLGPRGYWAVGVTRLDDLVPMLSLPPMEEGAWEADDPIVFVVR